jgi:hypothetical protein
MRIQKVFEEAFCRATANTGRSCRREENGPTARVLGWPPRNRCHPLAQSELFLEEDAAT